MASLPPLVTNMSRMLRMPLRAASPSMALSAEGTPEEPE